MTWPLCRLVAGGRHQPGGVADLVDGYQRGLSNGAVAELLGGSSADTPERFVVAFPAALLPLGTPQALIHGTDDDQVPVSQSRAYVAAAQVAGDDVRLRELPGIDPASAAWAIAVAEMARLIPQL